MKAPHKHLFMVYPCVYDEVEVVGVRGKLPESEGCLPKEVNCGDGHVNKKHKIKK